MKKTTKYLFAIVFAVLTVTAKNSNAAEVITPNAVVELFTSQGCHSCPPADKILGNLAKDDKTLALAWHVDYWDYLGWKDIFGSKENTTRQRRYAVTLGEQQIYTPQAVVNGRAHTVGSRGADIQRIMNQFTGTKNGLNVPIQTSFDADSIFVKVLNSPEAANATLWIVYFDDQKTVDVKRGENKGKKLTYSNIVRDVQMVGMVKGNDIVTALPISEIKRKGTDSCALILQKNTEFGTPGAIIGAAIIKDL